MKKFASLLLLGMSSLSFAGTYDFSRLENMSFYDFIVKNNPADLIIGEVERQNGRINAKYRAEVVNIFREAFNVDADNEMREILNMCKEQIEKCPSVKIKDATSFEGLKEQFLKMEEAARNEGQKFFIKEPIRSFNEYKNMTLSQLGQLPKGDKEELYDYIKAEYGMIYFSQIGRAIEGVGLICQEERLKAMFGNKKLAEARKEYKCDVKLKSLLK